MVYDNRRCKRKVRSVKSSILYEEGLGKREVGAKREIKRDRNMLRGDVRCKVIERRLELRSMLGV